MRVARKIEKDIAAMQAAKESFEILPSILDKYDPPPRVWELTELMLALGETDPDRLCEILVMDEREYVKIMRSPRNVAWISAVFRQHIPYMLGRLDHIMYEKAKRGSVAAYKAVLDRYNESGVKRSMVAHIHQTQGMDVRRMSDDALEATVRQKSREQFGEENEPGEEAKSAGGTGEEESGMPTDLLPAPPEAEGVSRRGEDAPEETCQSG